MIYKNTSPFLNCVRGLVSPPILEKQVHIENRAKRMVPNALLGGGGQLQTFLHNVAY